MVEHSLRYNNGKPRWSLVEFNSLVPMVRVLEYGEHRYSLFEDENHNTIKGADISQEKASKLLLKSSGRDNWKIDLNTTEVLESMSRHLFALMSGEEFDSESGLPHIGHIMCNAMFYNYHINKLKDGK